MLLHNKIFEEFGDIQLDNFNAEEVLIVFSSNVARMLRKVLSNEELYYLIELVRKSDKSDKSLAYHEFKIKTKLPGINQIFTRFEGWLHTKLPEVDFNQLEREPIIRSVTYF
jgi:hypothetical protein